MAQVTYRGIKYDTANRPTKTASSHVETYRGVKFNVDAQGHKTPIAA